MTDVGSDLRERIFAGREFLSKSRCTGMKAVLMYRASTGWVKTSLSSFLQNTQCWPPKTISIGRPVATEARRAVSRSSSHCTAGAAAVPFGAFVVCDGRGDGFAGPDLAYRVAPTATGDTSTTSFPKPRRRRSMAVFVNDFRQTAPIVARQSGRPSLPASASPLRFPSSQSRTEQQGRLHSETNHTQFTQCDFSQDAPAWRRPRGRFL